MTDRFPTPAEPASGGSAPESPELESALALLRQYDDFVPLRNGFESVFAFNGAGIIRHVSPAVEHLTGYTIDELIGRNAFELVNPADAPETRAAFDHAVQHPGEFVRAELRILRKDGVWRWIETIGVAVRDADGAALLGRCHDITERRRAEEAVRLLSQVVEGMHIGLYVLRLEDGANDESLRIVATNPAASQFTGVEPHLVAGRLFADSFPALRGTELIRRVAQVARSGAIDDIGGFSYGDERVLPGIFAAKAFPLDDDGVGFVFENITARKEAELALRESEERFRSIVETTTEWIWAVDTQGIITYSNPAVESILGCASSALIGKSTFAMLSDASRAVHHPHFLHAVATKSGWSAVTLEMCHTNGSYRIVESTASPTLDPSGALIGFRGAIRDITERKRAEDRIHYQAYHDSLTDLPNRELFLDRLTVSLIHAQRRGEGLAVFFLDIDHFKLINDTLGHSVGDALLQRVARRLQGFIRSDETLARVGGDEFLLLVPGAGRTADAEQRAQMLLEAMAKPFVISGNQLYATISIGIALYPANGTNAETLLKNADSAMYQAKEIGRNAFQFFTPVLDERSKERFSLETDLRHALARGEFELHYQPLYEGSTWSIAGVEALIRWNHPTRGMIGPDDFIPLAEETRMIVPIGDWVMRTAFAQARLWQTDGFPSLRVGVNLSAKQLQHGDVVDSVRSAIEDCGIDPRLVEIEITESVAMQNADWTLKILGELRAMGVNIAVDDFGTGQSSLAYLTRFPFSTVKIDRAFVGNVTEDENDAAVVSAVVALAQSLKLRTVAEGVETVEQLAFLSSRGCDEMQGFYFSRPLPIATLDALLRSQEPRGHT
jgi:diguanylate cyclase (GGDEF)-like protein/PAS domain S-box-containing protein